MLELDRDLGDARVEHPQRLLEQLLAGLVALEDDNPQSSAMGGESTDSVFLVRQRDRARGRLARASCRARARRVLPPRARRAVVVRGAHWEAGERGAERLAEALEPAPTAAEPLGDVRVTLVRHRGEHRIADAFCSGDHLADWAKAGGRWASRLVRAGAACGCS